MDARSTRRWRSITLVVVGVMVGLVMLSPVSAHLGKPNHMWNKHFKSKVQSMIQSELNKLPSDDPCAKGHAMGYASVQGLGLSSSFTTITNAYNCKGGTVEARRTALGEYRVRFNGMPIGSTASGLVAQVTAVGGSGGTIVGYGSATQDIVVNTYDNTGNEWDKLFSVTIFDPGTV